MSEKITIEPATRLEGHAKIDIHLNDKGNVDNAYFQTVELRGFEKFCQGREVEEMPRITPRICGVCPWAHHTASTKALDGVFGVQPNETAEKLRRLANNIFQFSDKVLNFYYLAAPDFVMGPESAPENRNVVGMVDKLGKDKVKQVASIRRKAQEVLEVLGGRDIHPVLGIPGGTSRGLNEDERKELQEKIKEFVEFAKFSLELFKQQVLENDDYVDMIMREDLYYQETNYMGLVDDDGNVNFYDGKAKIDDKKGNEIERIKGDDYKDKVKERSEPWSYPKMPYLKKKGWNGLQEGDNGITQVGPLARLNVAEGMATPLAQEAYKEMYETVPDPCHHTMANHWARIIDMLYSAEKCLNLIKDPNITNDDFRREVKPQAGRGVGIVEAPRGTLIHDYKANEDGILEKANIVVATTFNIPSINMSVRKAAKQLVSSGNPSQGTLNKVEMAFRAHDPCLACATHSAVGETPLKIDVYDSSGNQVDTIQRK